MKSCPVCQSKTFDDASICFGCMYRYDDAGNGEEGETDPREVAMVEEPRDLTRDNAGSFLPQFIEGSAPEREAFRIGNMPSPAFFIKMTPAFGEAGQVTWACAVELAT